jgi:hypothetical protein
VYYVFSNRMINVARWPPLAVPYPVLRSTAAVLDVLVPVLFSTEKTDYSRFGFTVLYRRDRWLTEKTENVPWYRVSAQIPTVCTLNLCAAFRWTNYP